MEEREKENPLQQSATEPATARAEHDEEFVPKLGVLLSCGHSLDTEGLTSIRKQNIANYATDRFPWQLKHNKPCLSPTGP